MTREPRKVWDLRVQRWERSGLPAKVFAAREGVSRSTLNWWRWKLRGGRSPKPELPSFVEVVAAGPAALEPGNASIEVVLPSGVRLVAHPGFDGGDLRRLLAILEER